MSETVPVVTVVTVCRNARAHIRECMASVQRQRFPQGAIEYLLVDGLSDDGTVELVREAARAGVVTRFISEKDGGVYDAMNKGVRLAQGRYIALLNSDDWFHPDMLARSIQLAEATGADYVVSDAWACNPQGRRLFRFRADLDSIAWEAPYAHLTLVCRKEVYARLNGYDTSFRIAGDYDLMWRLHRLPARCVVLRAALSSYRLGGLSSGDNYGEVLTIYAKNGDEIRERLRASRLNLIGFMAMGANWMAQALQQRSGEERQALLCRARDVYRLIGVDDAVRAHDLARTWDRTLGGVMLLSADGAASLARPLGVARRLRARYVLGRHGLGAVLSSAVYAFLPRR
jgi:glycosyltransferase involved in cell wall biosynthesis